MNTGTFCVPNPCTLSGITGGGGLGCEFEWCAVKCQPLTFEKLYAIGYVLSHYFPILINCIPCVIENEVGSWLFWRSVTAAIPYFITFIVLFIILMSMGTISITVGILMMVLLIILVITCLAWMNYETSISITNTISEIKTTFHQLLAANKSDIAASLAAASLNPNSLSCTGANRSCPTLICGATATNQAYMELVRKLSVVDDATLLEKYRLVGANCSGGCGGCYSNNPPP